MTPTHVLDSSAVLAYLHKEMGWDVTAAILAKPTNACAMHAVNPVVTADHGEFDHVKASGIGQVFLPASQGRSR